MLLTSKYAMELSRRVLNFWFLNNRWTSLDNIPAKPTPVDDESLKRWFYSSPEFDQQIREDFEDDLSHLINDEYNPADYLSHPEQLLAFIIALDQFPRNIFRGDARAFSFDHKAKELSQLLINEQADKQLPYIERSFIYLPFEHSENLEDQNKAVNYMEQLYEDAKNDPSSNENVCNFVKQFVQASKQHREIIKQFGRFPHRNVILKRPPLESEEIYLRDGGERFGQ
ncbi:unnamed protein product [Adineta steineri]|uniref:DUF924 domain-containing protein n=1 Tax=Adineta steineri TaxID=433720 RepID=A0A818K7A7_9BILA|nr:unnamed protein product [Adineta steineri]CAF3551634.1 unnamed protein product [Adineta steineri]